MSVLGIGAVLAGRRPTALLPLGLPIDLPLRAVERAFSDLSVLASVARQMPDRFDALDARAEQILDLGERILALGEEINSRAETIVELGGRIDDRGRELLERGEQLQALGETINDRGLVIADRAQEVADRAAEVVATLPLLERAVGIAVPLEGAVERLGRMVDRLPGSSRAPRRPDS